MSAANYLRTYRKELGMTQDELAAALGMKRTTVVAIEHGQRRLRQTDVVKLESLGFPPYDSANEYPLPERRLMAVTDDERRLVKAYRMNSVEIVVRLTLAHKDASAILGGDE